MRRAAVSQRRPLRSEDEHPIQLLQRLPQLRQMLPLLRRKLPPLQVGEVEGEAAAVAAVVVEAAAGAQLRLAS